MSNVEKIKKNIEKFKKSIEEKRIKNTGRTVLKEQEEKRSKIYKKVEQLIKNEGGIINFMKNMEDEFTTKKLLFTNKEKEDLKWKFNEDKLVDRIEYRDLTVENKMKILKNNIKESIKEKIEEERLEKIEEKDLDEYINNIIEHELNYDKSHKQIINKKILKSITYAIGYWSKDKNIFYKSGIMALIRTEEEGWDLIKELKEKGRIEGEKWTVEKNTKELEDKIVYIDQRGNLYNFNKGNKK